MSSPRLPSLLFPLPVESKNHKIIPYNKLCWIEGILTWLDPPEVNRLRASPLGKLFDLASTYTFSGTFVHFLLSRKLSTKQVHEAWFVFAAKPWRFSLREYAIVTGLNCGKLPLRSGRKNTKSDYWDTLFPDKKSVTVEWLLAKIQSGSISDPEVKIRYAALLIVDCFLCAKSHMTLVSEESVELIKDLDAFLQYPWGTVSFDLTMKSINVKIKNLFEKPTLAVQGFLLPLQLVAFEAIPAIRGTLPEGRFPLIDPATRKAFQLATAGIRVSKVKDIEDDAEVEVISMIEGNLPDGFDSDIRPGEQDDHNIAYMVKLLDEDIEFDDDMWVCSENKNLEISKDKGPKDKTKKKRVPLSVPRRKETRKRKCITSDTDSTSDDERETMRIPSPSLVTRHDFENVAQLISKEIKLHISLCIADLEASWETRYEERFENFEKLVIANIGADRTTPSPKANGEPLSRSRKKRMKNHKTIPSTHHSTKRVACSETSSKKAATSTQVPLNSKTQGRHRPGHGKQPDDDEDFMTTSHPIASDMERPPTSVADLQNLNAHTSANQGNRLENDNGSPSSVLERNQTLRPSHSDADQQALEISLLENFACTQPTQSDPTPHCGEVQSELNETTGSFIEQNKNDSRGFQEIATADDETIAPQEIEQMNDENDEEEIRRKTEKIIPLVPSVEINFSDSPHVAPNGVINDDDDDESLKQRKLAIDKLILEQEARTEEAEKNLAKIRKWLTRRNHVRTGVSA